MSFEDDDDGMRNRGKPNPFDWNEEEENLFIKLDLDDQTVLGVSPRDRNSKQMRDFLKQSRMSDSLERDTITSASSLDASRSKYPDQEQVQITPGMPVTFKAGAIRGGSFCNAGVQNNSSIADVIKEKPQVSVQDYNALQAELLKCKQSIELLKHQKWKAIPPEETVKRIILGKPYSLEVYKSLTDKKLLLDFALKWHDGNAILAVVIFLKRTLKTSIFLEEVNRRPGAFQHYTQFLKENGEFSTLIDLYSSLRKMSSVAALQYEQALSSSDMKAQLSQLRALNRDVGGRAATSDLSFVLHEHCSLLEKQIRMESEDAELERDGRHVLFKSIPRSTSIPGKSIMTTTYYAALYHYDDKNTHLCHPTNLREEFKLTPKQYEWAVVPARAKLHRWTDIADILLTKKWLKSIEKSAIGFDELTLILHRFGAPVVILSKYLMLIENVEMRLKMAFQFKCHDVAIDTLVAMKDKAQLENYRLQVLDDLHYRHKINDLLNNSQIKWK